jgi:hypothetical protein
MKKTLGTYFTQYFKMPHLYHDDLQLIEETILDHVKPEKYVLSCEGMEFTRLADLARELDSAHVLVMYTHAPCMRLKFARSWAELYSGEETTGTKEATRLIAQVVNRRQRLWLWGFCKYAAWLAPLLGFGSLAIMLGLMALGYLEVRVLYLEILFLLLGAIWWGVGHRYTLHSFSSLDFNRTRGRTSLLIRHRSSIVLVVLSALFGAVTCWLLLRFLS